MTVIRAGRLMQLVRRRRTVGVCVTCMVMFGSGVRIGMVRVIMVGVLVLILRGLVVPRPACYAAAAGTTTRGTAGRLIASGTRPTTGTTPWAFVLLQFGGWMIERPSEGGRDVVRGTNPSGARGRPSDVPERVCWKN